MESPSPAAAEPGAPEAPLAAERVGCARPPPNLNMLSTSIRGIGADTSP